MIPLRVAMNLVPAVPYSKIIQPSLDVVKCLVKIARQEGVDFGINKDTVCALLKQRNGVFLSKKGDPRALGFLFDGVRVTHNRSDFERYWENV